jgi:hypothetical protein
MKSIIVAENKNNLLVKILFLVILPILVGSSIYAFQRPYSLYFIETINICIEIPPWCKYNLVDALWLFAFLNSIDLIWAKSSNRLHHYT